MPRSKTGVKRKMIDPGTMEKAVEFVLEKKMTIGEAAKHFEIKKPTLIHHLKAFKNSDNDQFVYEKKKPRQVFTEEEELLLVEYIKQASYMNYGLTLKQVRLLAYQYALVNHKKYDPSWDENKIAGEEWLRCFRKKYNDQLSLRKPEATSLSRATAFNKANVSLVFSNYKEILERHNFSASDIWNCDETGLSTVHTPPKVLARKGSKQVGGMTSGERGTTVTMISAVNAAGNFIPPMLIFPRVNYKSFMLNGAPPGSIGAANPSGWSNEDLFLLFLQHFINNAKPSVENPVLLMMDNHESHITVSAIDLAKKTGIVILTFHPHTSHKMQPLDRGVFGPFKTYYSAEANNWMISPENAGKPITIYDISSLVGRAYPRAFTPVNIIKGFEVSGMVPLNENIFLDDEFLPCSVTDRPLSVTSNNEDAHRNEEQTLPVGLPDGINQKSVSLSNQSASPSFRGSTSRPIISPEIIRPHPKAGLRKVGNRGRPKGKSVILTDTPEKIAIEERKKSKKQIIEKKTKTKMAKRNIFKLPLGSSEDESDLDMFCHDSEILSTKYKDPDNFIVFEVENIERGNFVLVKLQSKRSIKYYVSEITDIEEDIFKIKYLKKVGDSDKFTRGDENEYDIGFEDIIMKLPNPTVTGGSARQLQYLTFSVNLSTYDVE